MQTHKNKNKKSNVYTYILMAPVLVPTASKLSLLSNATALGFLGRPQSPGFKYIFKTNTLTV